MKMKKFFSAFVLLTALMVSGCTPMLPSASAASSSSAKPSSSKPSTTSSRPVESSSVEESSTGPSYDFDEALLNPLPRTWTEGTPETNADGKEYIPLTDATANKVGVKIKFSDFGAGSTATVSSGKLNPVNDHTVFLEYHIKAPKAGDYQMVMNGRVSDAAHTLGDRAFYVTLNDEEINVYGEERDAGLETGESKDFVAAPMIALTGNEDKFTVACSDYRIVFDVDAYIVFQEI